MARYAVNIVAGERRVSLLIVQSPDQLCSSLIETVKLRAASLSIRLALPDVDRFHVALHLNTVDGPLIDPEDVLSDVLPGATDKVYAVVDIDIPDGLPNVTTLPTRPAEAGDTLRIRVITPELARSSPNSNFIVPLQTAISLNCTLKELRGVVQQSLGFPKDDGSCPELECNCGFARQIDSNATFNDHVMETYDPLHSVIIVHGNNDVIVLPVTSLTLNKMYQAANECLSQHLEAKIINTVGGVEDTSRRTPSDKHYLKAPVLAVCSRRRHSKQNVQQGSGREYGSHHLQRDLIVDIHTSECPIEITAHNAGVTLAEAGLESCAINGVLNIYALQRWESAVTGPTAKGKTGIFKSSDVWEHYVSQTDRGTANLLSTLRVFTDLVAGHNMKDSQQDAVLHVMRLMTRFPPAVRATYVLMRGEKPRSSERAALSQCLYEVLKSVVPAQAIGSDPKRFFEGCRLLLGLVLEKAKNLKINSDHDIASELPYVSMPVHDLRNQITMDPILSIPVHTRSGLIDRGFFAAFQENGPLKWTNTRNTNRSAALDQAWARMAILAGGTKSQVVRYNADTIESSRRYTDRGDINKIIAPAEYNDLHYLANLCSRNQLTVVPPSKLASATSPVLTLDREGSLAVYVGRAACAEPGRDMLMFRPLSNHEEEAVDVSVITDLLEPILAQRSADGTIVFEAYGDHQRKAVAPDEITILCVDLSCSMSKRCDFADLQTNEDDNEQLRLDLQSQTEERIALVTENAAFHLPTPDELKEYLKAHESYDDFLAIVNTGSDDFHRRQNAEKVMKILQQVHEQEIKAKSDELEALRQQNSHYAFRTLSIPLDRALNTLKNLESRLQKHKTLLCAWFLTCLDHGSFGPNPLAWTPGDEVPKVYKTVKRSDNTSPIFGIPREYCCHISNELMEDPVITVDEFTYDRRNIERWFQTNETSPLTNLVLPSYDLRPDLQKKTAIIAYLNASDITSKYGAQRGPSFILHVIFKSPISNWTLALPRDLTTQELWEIAFRLTKGRYMDFELQHKNAEISHSQDTIGNIIDDTYDVFVVPSQPSRRAGGADDETEELCLVKVYGSTYDRTLVSYWEPRNTTKSLASVIFRYYRQKFTQYASTVIQDPIRVWYNLHNTGDQQYRGYCRDEYSEPLSRYFTPRHATGTLAQESCVDELSDTEDLDGESRNSSERVNSTLVLKLSLDEVPKRKRVRAVTASRLDVLKQMFDAYVNRLLAYNFQTHVGLVTFGSKASVIQKITPSVESFRHKLNNMLASGDTALWDSLALAQDQIQHYAENYPQARLRIICISDGEDNKSKHNAVILTSRFIRSNIIVDSFILGNDNHTDLKTLSYLTGGLTFAPKTLEEAMAICELEPVLSLLERPDEVAGPRRIIRSQFSRTSSIAEFRQAAWEARVQRVTEDSVPERKQLPGLNGSFIELGRFARSGAHAKERADNNLRVNRIHNEIRSSGAQTHPYYDVYICESDMGLWKVVMQGPPESTYTGGTFLLYVEMGDKYPMFAPQARFITPIYHPNINRHGRICHSIFDRNWTVDTSTKEVIDTVYSLLLVPEASDPINAVVTLDYHWNEVSFKEKAQEHIAKHAGKTRAEWRAEITG